MDGRCCRELSGIPAGFLIVGAVTGNGPGCADETVWASIYVKRLEFRIVTTRVDHGSAAGSTR